MITSELNDLLGQADRSIELTDKHIKYTTPSASASRSTRSSRLPYSRPESGRLRPGLSSGAQRWIWGFTQARSTISISPAATEVYLRHSRSLQSTCAACRIMLPGLYSGPLSAWMRARLFSRSPALRSGIPTSGRQSTRPISSLRRSRKATPARSLSRAIISRSLPSATSQTLTLRSTR